MTQRFVVEGGTPLRGTVRPAGNKNAALPMIAAALLGDGPSDVVNVPRIRDVEVLLALIDGLGAAVSWTGPSSLRTDPSGLASRPLDPGLCSRLRASILLAGPLLARFGQVTLPYRITPAGGKLRKEMKNQIKELYEEVVAPSGPYPQPGFLLDSPLLFYSYSQLSSS